MNSQKFLRLTDLYDLGRPEDVSHEGEPNTRSAFASHAGVRSDEIVVTAGICLGINCALTWARLRCSGRTVLCPRPHFPAYPGMATLQGFRLAFYDLVGDSGWQPDIEKIISQIVDEDVAAILWNTPHNPTGTVFGTKTIVPILQAAESVGAVVVQDEAFASLIYQPEVTSAPTQMHPHLIRIGGLAKRFPRMADHRVGFVAAEASKAAEIGIIHRLFAVGSSVASQRAAVEVLAQKPEHELETVRQELREHRDYAVRELGRCHGIKITAPQAGIFLWVRLPDGTDARQFAYDLRENTGVWCVYGSSFGITAEPWIRFRFGVSWSKLESHCRAFRHFAQNRFTQTDIIARDQPGDTHERAS